MFGTKEKRPLPSRPGLTGPSRVIRFNLNILMDGRVKPGHDNGSHGHPFTSARTRTAMRCILLQFPISRNLDLRRLHPPEPSHKIAHNGERPVRLLDMRGMFAILEKLNVNRRVAAVHERFDLRERAILIVTALNRENRNADIGDSVLYGPRPERRIEPNAAPALE